MARRTARDLTVGVVAAFALAVLAGMLLFVGGESRLFSDRAEYTVIFPATVGLRVGSPVLMAGVQVGTVVEIRLPTDPAESGIQVRLGVERKYAGRVRENSQAALRILQVLSGEKYVEVTAGDPAVEALAEGSLIPELREGSLMERGEDIAENLSEITQSLKAILEPLERGEGLLGQVIQDPEFGREGLENLKGIVENLEGLTTQIRDGRGFIGRVLYDPEFSARVDDLSAAIDSLAGLAQCVSPEEGAICDLLADDGILERTLEELHDSAASLKRWSLRLEEGEGLLGRMINDPEYSERVSADLARAVANLAEITDKINSGEGSLGLLVNERTVYDGMEQVIAGVNDSKFARWLLRRYQRRGIELEEKEAAAEQAAAEEEAATGTP